MIFMSSTSRGHSSARVWRMADAIASCCSIVIFVTRLSEQKEAGSFQNDSAPSSQTNRQTRIQMEQVGMVSGKGEEAHPKSRRHSWFPSASIMFPSWGSA